MAKTPCPKCEKLFKGEGGLRWHLERIHGVNGLNGAQGNHHGKEDVALEKTEAQNTTPDPAHQRQGAEDFDAPLEEIQQQVDSINGTEEVPEPLMAVLDGLSRRIEGLEAKVAVLPEVRQIVEGLLKDRDSMRQHGADTEVKLRAVCRILRELENPGRTGFGELADDAGCGISLSEARNVLERAPSPPKFRQVARASAG